MRNILLVLLTCLSGSLVLAQPDIPVESWRTHNAYNKTIGLTSTSDRLVAAAKSAIYTLNTTTGESEQITGLSGLSDADISAIGYNSSKDLIIVTYQNGNIDLISTTRVENFSDLLLSSIDGSKTINHIYCRDEFAYLSADFGLMILNLEKYEVKESFFQLGQDGSDLKVYSSTISGDTIYLATETGILGGNLNDNLKDFNHWRRYGAEVGMPQSLSKVVLSTPTGLLAAFDNEGVFLTVDFDWTPSNMLVNKTFITGSQGDSGSLLVTDSVVYQLIDSNLDSLTTELAKNPMAAINFNNQPIIADNLNGIVFPETSENFYPDGPFGNEVVKLFGYKNNIIAIPPAYNSNFDPQNNDEGFFMFTNGLWENFNNSGLPNTITIPEFTDITDAMFAYATGNLYLSSFGYGVMEISESNEITIFNENNSSLENSDPPGNNVLVTALDANSTAISVANFNNPNAYHKYIPSENHWQDYAVSFPASTTVAVQSFDNSTVWLQVANTAGGGIMVFNSESGQELYIDQNLLPSRYINDMIVDLEGKIWLATDKGPIYFYDAANILDYSTIDPVQPIFEGNILFRNEKITALAVDGGNRIWMATTTGLWLFAEDGQELVYEFNTDNSPLPSNTILDIAVNHTSGEVFVATENGLVSFRSTATIADIEDPLKIFPNPVLRSSHDLVTIQGVPFDADFWITDSAGRLVYKAKANGNTAIWSGLSSNSNLSSGVYYVFVTTEDGDDKQVGKIALIN